QQPVFAFSEIAQYPGALPDHRAVDTNRPVAQYGVVAPQGEKIAVQPQDFRMGFPLAPVQHGTLETFGVGRVGEPVLHLRAGEARELPQELAAAFPDSVRQLWTVVGEIDKRLRRAEFLSL